MLGKSVLYTSLILAIQSPIVKAADIPSLQSDAIPPYYLLKLGGALVLVLLVFIAFTWGMKKFNGIQAGQGDLKILSGINLGAKEKVVIVEVSGKQLVLGVTASSINKLMVMESKEDLNSADGEAFRSTLNKVQQSGVVK